MRSSPSRRSPRLAQHGLHPTPPAKSAESEGARGNGAVSGTSLNESTTCPMDENGKKRNHIETPDSGRGIPFRSTSKTAARPGVLSQLETPGGGIISRENIAGGNQIITRRMRRAAISPRTRGSAIVSILASPGEFAASNTDNRRYVSPKRRSSAEATLHYLAKARRGVANKRSLGTGNGHGNHSNNLAPTGRNRRRRKTAATAIDKVIREEASESNNESSPKRKSSRKSFPTQFYHNLETIVHKGEQKGKSWRCSKKANQSNNESSAKRKSPRESFPAQSYHNIDIGTSSSGKEKHIGASESVLSPFKESKSSIEKEPQTKLGPKSSSHASATAVKEPSIPHKRRSTSIPNNSLVSLPAKIAKHNADKQRQGKRKKHRGLHSTSSLSALEAQSDASGKDVESDDVKRKISLSHRELQQQLSKSKNKPARKKADSGVAKKKIVKKPKLKTPNIEHTDADAGERCSSIAEKSSLAGHKDWKADAPGMKDNLELTATSTKLLTSLSNGRAPSFNHTQPRSSGIDSTENSAEDMSRVCVTKLLLSCLSEDSTEKGTVHAVSVPAAEKGTIQEKNHHNGKKQPGESSAIETDLFQTSTPDVVLDEGANETSGKSCIGVKGPLTLHSPGGGKFSWRKTPIEEVGPEQEKISMAHAYRESLAQEKREEQMVTPKETDRHDPGCHEGEPAGCLSQNVQWTCDVSTFEDYDEAMAHKREFSRKAKSSLSNTEEDLRRKGDLLIDDPARLTPTLPQKGKVFVESDRLSAPDNERINSWTCDVCQEATFEDYDEAMAHERQCVAVKTTQVKCSSSIEGDDDKASKCRETDQLLQKSEMSDANSKTHISKILSVMKVSSAGQPLSKEEAGDSPINSWICDICQEATFEDYDDAMAHERECIRINNTQSKLSTPNNDEREEETKKLKFVPNIEGPEKPTRKSQHLKFRSLSSPAQQAQKPLVHPADGVNANALIEPLSTPNKQITYCPARILAADVTTLTGRPNNQMLKQPTPAQNRDLIDDFSPLSLASPLCAEPMPNTDSATLTGKEALFPPQLNTAFPVQPAKRTSASRTKMTTELANPSRLSLVPHGLSPGTKRGEPQLRLIVAEKSYQEKMAEFGRLELEAKMVTQRMREIEGRINGLNTNAAQKNYPDSKSSLLQRSYSWSNCYESSEEEECRDEYYSQHRRREKRRTSSGEIKSNLLTGKKSTKRAEEDRYERTANRVKVRLRSSRHKQGKNNRSRYNDSKIYVESRDHRQTEHFTVPLERRSGYDRTPKRHKSHDYAPATKKRSDGGDSGKPENEKTQGSKKTLGSKRKKKSTHLESYVDGVPPQDPRNHATRRQDAGQRSEKESGPCSRKQNEHRDQWRQEKSTPQTFSVKKSVDSPVIEQSKDDGGDRNSGTDSTKLQGGFQGWETNNNINIGNSKDSDTDMSKLPVGVQGWKARDPLYWLAGGGNSSDDESWDFDGPMILPPPPI